MIQFTLSLDKTAQRPVVPVGLFEGCRGLLDTGSKIPVWVWSRNILEALGGILVMKNIEFGGFGGKTQGDLYRLNVPFGKIIYNSMPIIFHPMDDINVHMILASTNFIDMIYQIDMVNRKLNVDIPDNQIIRNPRVSTEDGKITVYMMKS